MIGYFIKKITVLCKNGIQVDALTCDIILSRSIIDTCMYFMYRSKKRKILFWNLYLSFNRYLLMKFQESLSLSLVKLSIFDVYTMNRYQFFNESNELSNIHKNIVHCIFKYQNLPHIAKCLLLFIFMNSFVAILTNMKTKINYLILKRCMFLLDFSVYFSLTEIL